MAFNGYSVGDLLHRGRYYVRWVTEYDSRESGAAQIKVIGWCIYDKQVGREVFQHEDRQIVEGMFKLLKDEEDNNVRRT
jgi:hypothetical protein